MFSKSKTKPLLLIKSFVVMAALATFAGKAGAQTQTDMEIAKNEILSSTQIKRDISLARGALSHIHPGYERYASAEVLSKAWDDLEARADRGLTSGAFYLEISRILTLIRCDHTKAELPKTMSDARKTSPSYLPLEWVIVEGRAIVTAATEDGKIKAGDEIISIDGRSIQDLRTALAPFIPVDGYNDFTKDTMMTASLEHKGGAVDHFGDFLFNPFAVALLEVVSPTGEKRQVSLERVNFDTWKSIAIKGGQSSFKSSINYEVWSNNTAYLRIDSFVNYRDPVNPIEVLDPIFKDLREGGYETLVLDLRQNGGGSSDVSHALFSYFIPTPRRMKTRAVIKSKDLGDYAEHIWTWDKRAMKPNPLALKKTQDGRYALRPLFYEDVQKVKPSKYGFSGKIIVLTSRSNSSGSTNFTSAVQAARPIVLIGENTGGSVEGPTAGIIFFMTLPESKIRIRIPGIQQYNNVNTFTEGRGLTPDLKVSVSFEDIKAGQDVILNRAKTYAISGE